MTDLTAAYLADYYRRDDTVRALVKAVTEAHQLLVWEYLIHIAHLPEADDSGNVPWRAWHLDPAVRDWMNSGEQALYDALMEMKPKETDYG